MCRYASVNASNFIARHGDAVMSTEPPASSASPPDLKVLWTRCALFIAVVGVLGSLHLSLNMDLKACPLCYYQRAFIMSVAAILTFGMFLPGVPTAAQTVLALAPAFAGACIAGFHTYLVMSDVLECPAGISGTLAAPAESLVMYTLLVLCLLGDLFHQGKYVMQGLGAMLLGFVFYTTSTRAVPAMPSPSAPYDETKKLDTCRKVYREKT
jgi:disulfide bond formation protein DsbB